MRGKLYHYVGPEPIRSRSVGTPGGGRIESMGDLLSWLVEDDGGGAGAVTAAATFVIDPEGVLRLADRRSEHVACAGGGPVLSAGEMFFSTAGDAAVEEVSNLSTGFCPEPESWAAVALALDRIGVPHPGRFTTEVLFRLCPRCGQWNVVKDEWFACQVCGGELPESWNFAGPGIAEPRVPNVMAKPPYRDTIATVRATLTSVFAEVDRWFDRPGEARAFRPPDGGWTVDEVLEHVTLTNHYLLLVIRKSAGKALARAARQGPVTEGESDLRRLDPIGERGSFPWKRPDHMVPTGEKPTGEMRSLMRGQVRECLDLLRRLGGGEGSLHRVRMSVHDSGRLDVYQWLQFLALHARRHLAQMAVNESGWRQAGGPG